MRGFAGFVAYHSEKLLAGYIALSAWPIFFMRADLDAHVEIAYKYVAAPLAFFCIWFGWRYREEFIAIHRTQRAYWFGMISLPFIAAVSSIGLVLQANAFLPPQTVIWMHGVVTAKTSHRTAKYSSWIVEVDTPLGHRKFDVSRKEYAAIEVGGYFQQKRRQGPLGFTYVWK